MTAPRTTTLIAPHAHTGPTPPPWTVLKSPVHQPRSATTCSARRRTSGTVRGAGQCGERVADERAPRLRVVLVVVPGVALGLPTQPVAVRASVGDWNDEPDRTEAEVRAALLAAAQRAEAGT